MTEARSSASEAVDASFCPFTEMHACGVGHSTAVERAYVGVLVQLALNGRCLGWSIVREIALDSKSWGQFQSDVPDGAVGAGVIIRIDFVVLDELWSACELQVVIHGRASVFICSGIILECGLLFQFIDGGEPIPAVLPSGVDHKSAQSGCCCRSLLK